MSDVRVKIFGAGSIGNHLAHACRGRGWAVTMCDRDPAALERTRTDIYPSRYGAWDDGIRLATVDEAANDPVDVVIVGTPPDSHLAVAHAQLDAHPPRVMVLEKPLCPPHEAGAAAELASKASSAGTIGLVGYNHTLTKNTSIAESWLAENDIGDIATIRSMTREHWAGIFGAHPWLSGPADTYLGYTDRGGGALGEHSHAVNIFQHFARKTGQGEIVSVSAELDMVEDGGAKYDRIAQLSVQTEGGMLGTIVQDVITEPAKKWLRVQGSSGYLEWEVGAGPNYDAVRTRSGDGDEVETRIEKTRPDDFAPETEHIDALLSGDVSENESPIAIACGLRTMQVIVAAIRSSASGRRIAIDPNAGLGVEAVGEA